jgi:hypothetical protein
MTQTMLYVILGIVGVLVLFAGWFVITGKTKWLREWLGYSKNLPVNGMMHCDDGYIRYPKLVNKPFAAQDGKRRIGYHHRRDLLIEGPDGKSYLPVDERISIPRDYFGAITTEDITEMSNTDLIAYEQGGNMEALQAAKDNQHILVMTACIIACGLVFIVIVFAIFKFWGGR